MVKFVILVFTVFLVAVVTSVPLGENSPSDTAEIECKAVCKQSTDYKPLCGKDGRTYPNESALNCKNDCATKNGKPEIEIAHDGKCPTDRPKTIPRVK